MHLNHLQIMFHDFLNQHLTMFSINLIHLVVVYVLENLLLFQMNQVMMDDKIHNYINPV